MFIDIYMSMDCRGQAWLSAREYLVVCSERPCAKHGTHSFPFKTNCMQCILDVYIWVCFTHVCIPAVHVYVYGTNASASFNCASVSRRWCCWRHTFVRWLFARRGYCRGYKRLERTRCYFNIWQKVVASTQHARLSQGTHSFRRVFQLRLSVWGRRFAIFFRAVVVGKFKEKLSGTPFPAGLPSLCCHLWCQTQNAPRRVSPTPIYRHKHTVTIQRRSCRVHKPSSPTPNEDYVKLCPPEWLSLDKNKKQPKLVIFTLNITKVFRPCVLWDLLSFMLCQWDCTKPLQASHCGKPFSPDTKHIHKPQRKQNISLSNCDTNSDFRFSKIIKKDTYLYEQVYIYKYQMKWKQRNF